jgi:hypothetical protein
LAVGVSAQLRRELPRKILRRRMFWKVEDFMPHNLKESRGVVNGI